MGLTKPRAAQIYDIDYKQATRVITVTNINLSGGAPSQVDNVNLSTNDRVLVIGQDTPSQNGIYFVATLGSGSNGTWTRTTDTDVTGELLAGTIVMVTEGTVYHDTQWKLTTNDPIVIGTTPLTFEQNSAFAFGNIYANGTAVLATTVGDSLTLTAGNNIQITGNNTAKSVTIGVTGISLTSIANGTSNVNVVSSGGNVAIGVGGTANIAVFSTDGQYITGIVSATGNVIGGNLSTAGNVTGSYLKGNANLVTGINSFSQILVTGATTVNASGLGSNVTFAAGSNIALTSDGSTITIAYSAAGGGSIFATGGDMGLISQSVTSSEDLGLVTDTPSTSYDLGTLFVTSTFNQIDMTGFTSNVNTGNLNATGLVSAAGNITGSYIFGNGSQLTGISSSLSGNLSGNLLGNGFGANTLSFVSATGNITGGNILTVGVVSATANITGGNILTVGVVSAAGNITGGNVFVTAGLSIGGNITSHAILETANITATAPPAPTNFDIITSAVQYYTANASANVTLNFRGNSTTTANTLLSVGQSTTVALLWTNGATAYYPNVYQIDGSNVTPKWQGGTAVSAGNANATDVYSFTIIKTAATPTYVVLASQTKFA